MNRKTTLLAGATALLALTADVGVAAPDTASHGVSMHSTLAVVMTNDATTNAIKVYDTSTGALVQTLSTSGAGGVAGNARGVRQYNGEIFAAVNYGSNTVALFRRDGSGLKLDRTVATSSAPVSIDFGNDHMYVAGNTTVDSFAIHGNTVGARDGTATLKLFNGTTPAAGATAQIGVLDEDSLIVTLKTDPTPGSVDTIALHKGAVTAAAPAVVSAPSDSLTPFGFVVYPDATAVITLAHSNHDGLFRDGAFIGKIASGQTAPCWATRVGKYTFTANTGSKTISRLLGTGTNIFIDNPTAAQVVGGGSPSDIDADGDAGVLGVIDRGTAAHLSLFAMNDYGELFAIGTPIDVGAANATGVAIMPGR